MNSFHTSPDKRLALLPDLTQIKANPTPTPVVFAAFFLPWLLCYLVHLPGTRMYRIGLLPPSLMAAAWCMLGDNQSWGPSESDARSW